MIYAKIDANQRVVGVYTVGTIDELLIQALDDGEAFVPMSQSEFYAFEQSPRARYIDGIFTIDPPNIPVEPEPPSLEDLKTIRLSDLRQYTKLFILTKSTGGPRYPLDSQASFNRIYSKIERKLRLCAIPDEIKAAIAGGTIGIAKVYQWVMSFLERNNASQETIDEANALKTGYQAGTVTMHQIFQWALAVLADMEAQYSAKIEIIDAVNDWIHTVIERHYSVKAAVNLAASVEALNAITWDYSDLNASDPGVSLEQII